MNHLTHTHSSFRIDSDHLRLKLILFFVHLAFVETWSVKGENDLLQSGLEVKYALL